MLLRAGCLLVMLALLLVVAENAGCRPVQHRPAGAGRTAQHETAAAAHKQPSAEAAIVADLIAAMNSGDRQARSAAVSELGSVTASLLSLFRDFDAPALREHMLCVLIEIGLEDQIPIETLREITANGSLDAQGRAWGVLSRKDMFSKSTRVALAELAKNPSAAPRSAHLTDLRPAPLPERSSSSSYAVARRPSSDLTINRARQAGSIPEWIQLLDGMDPRLREIAAHALGDFGPKAVSAVPTLARHLADESDLVRLYSAYALASIGPAASEAVPALQRSAQSDDPALRSAASHALAKIVPAATRK